MQFLLGVCGGCYGFWVRDSNNILHKKELRRNFWLNAFLTKPQTLNLKPQILSPYVLWGSRNTPNPEP